ncbi:MAG: NAD(P)H-hydrate dehydratase [Anaerolineae bacterium]
MAIPILSVADVRSIEVEADTSGISYAEMMRRAGRAIATRLVTLLSESGAPASDWRVTFLIGPGSNGGDGLVAGHLLAAETSALVRFYLLKPRTEDDPLLQPVRAAGLPIAIASDDQRFRVLSQMVSTSLIVVDSLFGIGARLPLGDDARRLLSAASAAMQKELEVPSPYLFADQPPTRHFRPHVLAIDCPSGADCDTGALDEAALPANETLTMIAVKPGLLTFPVAAATGRLASADLGLSSRATAFRKADHFLMTAEDADRLLPRRSPDSHKGTFGHILIVGGSANYPGAPALSARAAYRMGAGLVTVATPAPVVEWLAGSLPESTWVHLPHDLGAVTADGADLIHDQAFRCSVMVLGMGLGRENATRELLANLFGADERNARKPIGFSAQHLTAVSHRLTWPPLVLDADGLSLLSTLEDWPALLPPDSILTPHPGEMARLCGLSAQEVVSQRWDLAREKAAEWNAVLVLKGAHTLIAAPDGQMRVLPFKTSALATAGTGDVLAGMIGTLRAQGLSAFDAASVGAFLHGAAGVRAGKKLGNVRGVCASDVIAEIPGALNLVGVQELT